MNQPTREEFEAFKAEVREEVKQLREQRTEEIKVTRIEVASEDVLKHLDRIDTKQDKFSTDIDELKIDAKAYIGDAAIFKNKVEHMEVDVSTIKTDIEQVKTVQNGHSKFFEEHGKRLAVTASKDDISRLETAMATKDDLAELKNLILQLLQQKDK